MSLIEELKRRNVFRVAVAYGVAAWLLLQITDILVPMLDLPDSAGRFILLLIVIGFIPALVFAWAYELTPEGIRKEKEVDRNQSIAGQTGKKLDRVIIAGLLLIIVGMGVERYWFAARDDAPAATQSAPVAESSSIDPSKTIAVLPFADLSQAQDQGWFSDGLAEEILNALARAPDLLVSSRTSSFAYKGSNTPIAQIAEELGVAHVLEGSVRRAGDRIRVTAQLIRAADGFHVWSENYDRQTSDVIQLQEELAVNIAKALKTTMDPQALQDMLRVGTRSVEAYEHYLNGLTLSARAWEEPGWESFRTGYEAFETAREIDPDFASAHYQAAMFWLNQISISRRPSGLVSASPAEKMAAFRERIGQAIETTGNETDRLKFRARLAQVEARVRDSIALGSQVFEQRPYDFDNVEHLFEVAQDAQDLDTQLRVFRHAYELREQGPDWLRAAISAAFRLTFAGGDTGMDNAAWIRSAMLQSRKASAAYQAHRTLLWFGDVEGAREMLPFLASEDAQARLVIDFRQACAEGRRSEAERLLQAVPEDWTAELKSSTRWHLHQMLGQKQQAAAVLKPFESQEAPYALVAYLGYPDFDPEPFPVVKSIMQREGIVRRPPADLPFACPDQDVVHQESVAVLPFTSMSSGEDDGYFADGLTEEILNSLAQLPELLVTARTSSFHFKGQNIPVPEIARTLGVDHVVEGSVRRAGDRVRITAQLIRASDGFHLWSNTYDRTLEDVFAVQEDIAANIAETLDVVLDESKLERMRNVGIRNVDAFIAFQKGLKAFEDAHGNLQDVTELLGVANRYFDIALAAAPDLISARILKADEPSHHLFDHVTGDSKVSLQEEQDTLDALRAEYEQAWKAASPGLQRDVLDAERSIVADSWKGLSTKLDKALTPGGCVEVNWTYETAIAFGRAEQVSAMIREELRCNPYGLVNNFVLAFSEVWNGNPEETLRIANEAQTRGVSFNWMEEAVVYALFSMGRFDDERVQTAMGDRTWIRYPRELLNAAAAGDTGQARALAEAYWASENANDWSALNVAAIVGDRESANRYAARMDAHPGSQLVLANLIYVCACGAPFDLEAAPNFEKRVEEAGFQWPPASPIDWPLKDW